MWPGLHFFHDMPFLHTLLAHSFVNKNGSCSYMCISSKRLHQNRDVHSIDSFVPKAKHYT